MKKILLLSLFALFIVNKAFPIFAISGLTTVCASINGYCAQKYTYQVTGFPAGSTDHWVGLPDVFGGGICKINSNGNGDQFEVAWISDCVTPNPAIRINSISWRENGVSKYYNGGPITLVVNVARLAEISPPSWNTTPMPCSTSPITYSIASVCGASNYTWSLPIGWVPTTPINGANVTSITVIPTATSGGDLSVTAYNTNNGCNLSRTHSVNITRPVQSPIFTTTKNNYCLTKVSSAQLCVAGVPNAISYSWTYPSGWSGPTSSTSPCVTVNFNGVLKTGNICCIANTSCGAISAASCFSVTTVNAEWPFPTIFLTTQTLTTPTLGKKNIVLTFDNLGFPYTWFYYLYNSNNTLVSTASGSNVEIVGVLMGNGQKLIVRAVATNDCATSYGDLPYNYQLLNGVLITYPVAQRLNGENETSSLVANEIVANEIKIYPNPASHFLNVDVSEAADYTISLFDVIGRKVIGINKLLNSRNSSLNIDVSEVPNGVYFLNIENGSEVKNQKVIVKH